MTQLEQKTVKTWSAPVIEELAADLTSVAGPSTAGTENGNSGTFAPS